MSNKCHHCGDPISRESTYTGITLFPGVRGGIPIPTYNILFHPDCFRTIAGDEYADILDSIRESEQQAANERRKEWMKHAQYNLPFDVIKKPIKMTSYIVNPNGPDHIVDLDRGPIK